MMNTRTLNWVPLEKRWNNHLLKMLFKCLTDNAQNYLSSKFSFVSSNHSHGTRSQTFNALNHPQWKINPGKRTFHNRACSAWNQLPITSDAHITLFTVWTVHAQWMNRNQLIHPVTHGFVLNASQPPSWHSVVILKSAVQTLLKKLKYAQFIMFQKTSNLANHLQRSSSCKRYAELVQGSWDKNRNLMRIQGI